MCGLFRSLLICLLVLALPTQGVAAATMAYCHSHHPVTAAGGSPLHEAQTDSGALIGQYGHDHTANDETAVDSHAGHEDGSAMDPGWNSAPVETQTTHPTPSDPHKCSACAVCCAATATSDPPMKVPAAGVARTVFSAVIATVERFSAGGPDRPPRVLFVQ
jgi:hypothetical protein